LSSSYRRLVCDRCFYPLAISTNGATLGPSPAVISSSPSPVFGSVVSRDLNQHPFCPFSQTTHARISASFAIHTKTPFPGNSPASFFLRINGFTRRKVDVLSFACGTPPFDSPDRHILSCHSSPRARLFLEGFFLGPVFSIADVSRARLPFSEPRPYILPWSRLLHTSSSPDDVCFNGTHEGLRRTHFWAVARTSKTWRLASKPSPAYNLWSKRYRLPLLLGSFRELLSTEANPRYRLGFLCTYVGRTFPLPDRPPIRFQTPFPLCV